MYLSILTTISEKLSKKEIKAPLKKVYMEIVLWGSLAPALKSAVGKTLHQKLATAPRIGYWPQIRNPRSFNEKILHRKLFTDEEFYSYISDKWKVREYVREKVGGDILNEVYHVTDDPESIPFDDLPEDFVVKPTHGSGWVEFVEDKEEADLETLKSKCEDWMSQEYGGLKEEYWYRKITPRILIEERLVDNEHGTPPDFKFFVFHGDVEYIEVDHDRFTDHSRRIYDTDWNPQEFEYKFPLGSVIEEPEKLEEMIEIAETLGEDFDFVRVDLYQVNTDKIVFGELSLAPESGGGRFSPQEYDFKIGSNW